MDSSEQYNYNSHTLSKNSSQGNEIYGNFQIPENLKVEPEDWGFNAHVESELIYYILIHVDSRPSAIQYINRLGIVTVKDFCDRIRDIHLFDINAFLYCSCSVNGRVIEVHQKSTIPLPVTNYFNPIEVFIYMERDDPHPNLGDHLYEGNRFKINTGDIEGQEDPFSKEYHLGGDKNKFGYNFVLKSTKSGRKKNRIRFTNVDDLVKSPSTPIEVGMRIQCTLNDVEGVIMQDHQGKAYIQYSHEGVMKNGSITQFYKHITQKAFSKSIHWSQIVFINSRTSEKVSLEDVKFLLEGPRKVMSAFMYFSNEMRELYKNKMTSRNIVKMCGTLWNSMDESKKKTYKEKEEIDRERFFRQKQEWSSLLSDRSLGSMSNDNDNKDV